MSKWMPFLTSFDTISKARNISRKEAEKMLRNFLVMEAGDGNILANALHAFVAEVAWATEGRPAYRVSNPLARALCETSLELDPVHVRFPHRIFSVEVPRGFDLLNCNGARLQAILVSCTYFRHNMQTVDLAIEPAVPDPDRGNWRLNITCNWEDEHVSESHNNLLLSMVLGEEIQHRLDTSFVSGSALIQTAFDPDRPLITPPDITQKIFALAVGSALFAVGANRRYIRPVVSHGKKKRRKGKPQVGDPRKRWVMGADILLPRRGGRGGQSSSPDDEGRHLLFSHLRQGHLRLQPSGPQSERQYTIKYISPMVVRPDLPRAPQATRHVMKGKGKDE